MHQTLDVLTSACKPGSSVHGIRAMCSHLKHTSNSAEKWGLPEAVLHF
jgi:hypothetical protein